MLRGIKYGRIKHESTNIRHFSSNIILYLIDKVNIKVAQMVKYFEKRATDYKMLQKQ